MRGERNPIRRNHGIATVIHGRWSKWPSLPFLGQTLHSRRILVRHHIPPRRRCTFPGRDGQDTDERHDNSPHGVASARRPGPLVERTHGDVQRRAPAFLRLSSSSTGGILAPDRSTRKVQFGKMEWATLRPTAHLSRASPTPPPASPPRLRSGAPCRPHIPGRVLSAGALPGRRRRAG